MTRSRPLFGAHLLLALLLGGALGCDVFVTVPQDLLKNGCSNGQQDNDESDIDCGGSCSMKCAVSKNCRQPSDCMTNTCQSGKCGGSYPDHCYNGFKDFDENGIDCGGSQCASCGSGTGSNCGNGQQDGAEADVDCGGATNCARCVDGRHCNNPGDCSSNQCNMSTCGYGGSTNTCSNWVQDGTESDIDCGDDNNMCNRCAVGNRCTKDTNCNTSLHKCLNFKCSVDSCANGIRDGTETDVDCGGSCSAWYRGNGPPGRPRA